MKAPSTLRALARPFVAVVLALFGIAQAAAAVWTRTEWRGEKAWVSVSGRGWTAIVSEERARLIALMSPGGGTNMLFADQKDEFSWGGHRFWLGPQTAWSAPWPPPSDWETSPAARTEAENATLKLAHRRTNPDYPAITRTYEWRREVLHCTAQWNGPRFHGIHILQVPPETVVRVKRAVSDRFPMGYVLLPVYKRPGVFTDREASPVVARVDGDDITLRNAKVTEKIGVPRQPIVAELGGYRMTMCRGAERGMSDKEPDMGMLTQVFLGSDRSVFTEIEQLTPFGGTGEAFSEILIEVGGPRTERVALRNPVRRR